MVGCKTQNHSDLLPSYPSQMASTRRLLSRRVVVRGVVQSALGVGLGALLSACSGGAGSAKKPQATLRLATMEGNGQAPRTRAYLKEFQKSTGIAVSLISVSNYYTQNIHAMVAGGLPPDALFLTRTEFDDLTSRNHLVDLQARFQQDSSLVHAFFPIALQEWTRGGKLFALPSGIRVLFATYNTDLFREYGEPFPPASWAASGWSTADLLAGAEKMSRPGTAAQEANYGFYVAPTYLVYASFLVNAGASIVDVTRKAIDLDGDGVLQVLGQLQTLFTKKGVTPPNDLVAADNGLDLFANGQLGLTITDPSTITARQSQAHFVWDVGVLPAEVPERKTTGTGAGYALLTSGKQQDAAWRLVTYLVSAQVQQREAPVGDWIPSRPAVATSATFLPEIDNVDLYPQHAKLFVDVLTEGRVVLQPLLSNWPAVRSALDAAIQGLWTGAQTPGETVAKMKQIAGPLVQQG